MGNEIESDVSGSVKIVPSTRYPVRFAFTGYWQLGTGDFFGHEHEGSTKVTSKFGWKQ
jgi:hypothetical protein